MQHFPPMIKHEGIIRLKVAAICTCLDTMSAESTEDEEEIAPFHAVVEQRYYDRWNGKEYKTSGQVEPHAFLYLTPTGSLGEFVETVLSAMKQSIESGELKAVERKVDLVTGEINVEETWISIAAFEEWCTTRSLELDDFCARYYDTEEDIVSRISDLVYEVRRDFEAPLFDAMYAERSKLPALTEQNLHKAYDSLIREHILLKMGFDPGIDGTYNEPNSNVSEHDKPLRTTERNALLSIIAVLCDENGYDTARAAKTATIIKNRADLAGIALGETTVENHLKKIPDAITRRLRREPK
jgi:hypothetical protein